MYNVANYSEKSIELLAFGRALRKITQDELSLYSCVDRSYISELENGEKAPSLLSITSLARAPQVKASVLVEGYERELEK